MAQILVTLDPNLRRSKPALTANNMGIGADRAAKDDYKVFAAHDIGNAVGGIDHRDLITRCL